MAKYLNRTVDEVIAWSRAQMNKPTQSFKGLCQQHCRSAYGVNAWSPSAIEAWKKIPASKKHAGGKPSEAPRGAILYYSGGQYGHVALAIGKRTNDKCLTNDYVQSGRIGVAPRTFPRWGLHYLGWSTWTPYGSLKVSPTQRVLNKVKSALGK